MAIRVQFGRRTLPVGLPTLAQVQALAAQAAAAASTAATDAVAAAQPALDAARSGAEAARDAAVAVVPAVEAARDAAVGYETRAEAEVAQVPAAVKTLRIGGLAFRRDPAGTALATADGQKWSPADPVPTVRHYAQVLNLSNDDAPAVNALIAEAAARGDREVHINSPVRAMTPIALYGGIVHRFGGPITWAGGAGHVVGIVDRGGYEERGTVHNIEIVGNDQADFGLMTDHMRYWDFYGTRIRGFAKLGAWAAMLATTADNRMTVSNNFYGTILGSSDNLLLLDSSIGQSANSGASFNTFYGGRGDSFGTNRKEINYGVRGKIGEGNKFINFRVAAKYEWSRCWDMNDAATQLIGCAGDGATNSAFLYILAGTTGTINRITVAGVVLMNTPVAWQGSRAATALAVVAQIVAEGKQYPATAIRSIAYGDQVIFYNVDAGDNEIPLSDISQIAVTKTGDIVYGTSASDAGSLQGPPYNAYQDVNRNKWGYETGRGGSREVYGFYINPGFGGTLHEPEGNGPTHLVWIADTNTQRRLNIIRKGNNVFGDGAIASDAVLNTLAGQINAYIQADPAFATVTHTTQNLWIVNQGAFAELWFNLVFTPTIISGVHSFYVELPQKPGVYNTTAGLDVSGLPHKTPIEALGLNSASAAGKTMFASLQGNTVSPNGHPCFRITVSDGNTAPFMNTSYFVSGQAVTLRGQLRYPVNRFK